MHAGHVGALSAPSCGFSGLHLEYRGSDGPGTGSGISRNPHQAGVMALEHLQRFLASPFVCHLVPLMWEPLRNREVPGQGNIDSISIVGEGSFYSKGSYELVAIFPKGKIHILAIILPA